MSSMTNSLCMGDMGVELQVEVFVSVSISVWITIHCKCISLVTTQCAKYQSVACGVKFVGMNGFVMEIHSAYMCS